MENFRNKLRLDYADSPDLQDVFLLKNLGDRCTLEIEFVVTEKDNSGVTGKIKSVYASNYDKQLPAEYNPSTGEQEVKTVKESKTIKPSVDAPIMVVLGGSDYK